MGFQLQCAHLPKHITMQAIQSQTAIGKMSLTQRSTFSGKSVAVARTSTKPKAAFRLRVDAAQEFSYEVEKPLGLTFASKGGKDGGTVNVKRLNKREAPKKFGKKLTAAQKERATHLCIDCGFIYYLPTPFAEQPASYICPQCQAPKSRFLRYDPETGKTIGSSGLPPIVGISL